MVDESTLTPAVAKSLCRSLMLFWDLSDYFEVSSDHYEW